MVKCPLTRKKCWKEECGVYAKEAKACSFTKLDDIAKSLFLIRKVMTKDFKKVKKKKDRE